MTVTSKNRFWVALKNESQWYAVMAECREWFGKDWACQSKIKRKLERISWQPESKSSLYAWFEVPDLRITTWISTKLGLEVRLSEKVPTDK